MKHDKFPDVDLEGLDALFSIQLLTKACELLKELSHTFLCSALCAAGGGEYGKGNTTEAVKALVDRIERTIHNKYRARMVHLADWYIKTYKQPDVMYMDCELVKFRIDFANHLIGRLQNVPV